MPDRLWPDPIDGLGPAFTASIENGRLTDLRSRLGGEDRRLLSGPAGADGDVAAEWTQDGATIRASLLAKSPELSFRAPLSNVEQVIDGHIVIQRWDVTAETNPLFLPIGRSGPLTFAVRRVLVLGGGGHVDEDGCWRVALSEGRPVDISITVRAPLISDGGTYPTHDGGTQLWRTVLPPDPPAGPVPLIVGLHGGNSTADNFMLFSNPSWTGGWKAVLAMALGAVLIAPNANPASYLHRDTPSLDDIGDLFYEGVQKHYVFDAIEEACRRWPIDRTRIYLMGQSMGGHGTLSLAAKHPDSFAAGVAGVPPCDLGAMVRNVPQVREMLERKLGEGFEQHSVLQLAENLLHTPLVIRGGAQDPAVNAATQVQPMIDRLQQLGYRVTGSINPTGHHVDYETIEGSYEQAAPLLLQRPQVETDPDRIVYRTCDPEDAPGAWWLRVLELAGPGFGRVEVQRTGRHAVVHATNVAWLCLGGGITGCDVFSDVPCEVVLGDAGPA